MKFVERVFVISLEHAPPEVQESPGDLDHFLRSRDVEAFETHNSEGLLIDLASLTTLTAERKQQKLVVLPVWLVRIIELAWKYDCTMVLLHPDEEIHPDVPTFDTQK